MFQGTIVVTSSFLGINCGKWSAGKARFSRLNSLGLAIIAIAIIALNVGKRT
jgi:hypothetical protein